MCYLGIVPFTECFRVSFRIIQLEFLSFVIFPLVVFNNANRLMKIFCFWKEEK